MHVAFVICACFFLFDTMKKNAWIYDLNQHLRDINIKKLWGLALQVIERGFIADVKIISATIVVYYIFFPININVCDILAECHLLDAWSFQNHFIHVLNFFHVVSFDRKNLQTYYGVHF